MKHLGALWGNFQSSYIKEASQSPYAGFMKPLEASWGLWQGFTNVLPTL